MSKLFKVRTGVFPVLVYEPPVKLPPIEEKDLKGNREVKKMKYNFKIEELIYSSDDIDAFMAGQEEKTKKETKPKDKEDKPKEVKKVEK